MGTIRNVNNTLVGKYEGKRQLGEELGVDGKILEWILGK
jgi:hypothetical protein